MTTTLFAIAAGAVGAAARYILTGAIQNRSRAGFPTGTLTVNLAGALALGLLAGGNPLTELPIAAAAGFLGGFTTFSTWMIETIRLGESGLRSPALLNISISTIGGVALAALGYSLVT